MPSKIIDEKSIKEALECPVCKDLFTEPKQLECGHTYCLDCVEQLDKVPTVSHQIVGEDFFDTLGVGPVSTLVQCVQSNVQCPQCRKMCLIPDCGLNTNYALKDMVEQFRQTVIAMSSSSAGGNDNVDGDDGKMEKKGHAVPCLSCGKKGPESEMFMCRDCKPANKAINKQTFCAICVINSHRQHEVIPCTEVASTKERDQAALRIEAIGSQAQELAEQTKFIQNDLQKGFDAVRKKLLIKLNHLQLLQIECYDCDVNPLKEDVEGRVHEAGRQCEQLNKGFSQLHKLKLEFEGQLKLLDHNIDIAFAPSNSGGGSSFLRQLRANSRASGAEQQPSSSGMDVELCPVPRQWNHFAYSGKDMDKKHGHSRRPPPRRRSRYVSNSLLGAGGGSAMSISDAPSPIPAASLVYGSNSTLRE